MTAEARESTLEARGTAKSLPTRRGWGTVTAEGESLRSSPRDTEVAAGAWGWGPTRVRKADLLFRISSLEPMDCSPEIVKLVAE